MKLETRGAYYGPAIHVCWEEEDGTLWVAGSEYSNRVNFCPFCGFESTNKFIPAPITRNPDPLPLGVLHLG